MNVNTLELTLASSLGVMHLRSRKRKKRDDVLAAAAVTIRAVRDSADVFPPLKTAASALITICEMIQVSSLRGVHLMSSTEIRRSFDLAQRVKTNKEECIQVANRASQIIHDIYMQTKDYEDRLPDEVKSSVKAIEW